MRRRLALILLLVGPLVAHGHGLALARLDLRPLGSGHWSVQWSGPLGTTMPHISATAECRLDRLDARALQLRVATGAASVLWDLDCSRTSAGRSLVVRDPPPGLPVIARLSEGRAELHAAGESFVLRLDVEQSLLGVARSYFQAGVTHVMGGADHLLMLLCLVLLAVSVRRLLVAASMFTVGHTITLVATTLGWMRFDPRLGELLIACTLAWSAVALVSSRQAAFAGGVQLPAAALIFGLVHGLGFASSLGAVGLPPGALLSGLAAFNVGVEVGQVLIISAAVLALSAWRASPRMPQVEWFAAYGVGTLSIYWILERM